jgi:hypothetical protein
MKMPSLQMLSSGLKNVFFRFPMQLIIALIAVALAWHIIDVNNDDEAVVWVTSLCCCNFALTLLIASDLFCEVRHFSSTKKWLARILMLLISIGLYFMLDPEYHEADIFRIFMFVLAFHLLVAFAPFIGKNELNGFWQYNRRLFLRFLLAALYAAVLYAGLAIALAVVHALFRVDISYKWYLKLFALVSSGFLTIFFLAGMPDDFKGLAEDRTYPKGLKIFTQYVLIPLMTIYLAILLTYEIKIVLEWTMPKGLVSYLVLGYAVFGILSLLLIYPIKDQEGNGWIRLFSKFFYLMMIPLLILLLLAIGKRVADYGVTESRYILIVLGLWLTAITLYFLLSKRQNIKIIPTSLCLIALLATYGPQSAFSISKYSQLTRLKKIIKSKDEKDVKERADIVRYLVDRHGFITLQPFTKVNLSKLEAHIEAKAKVDSMSAYQIYDKKTDTIFSLLKISDGYNDDAGLHMSLINEKVGTFDVKGYDVMFIIDDYSDSLRTFDGNAFKFNYRDEKQKKDSNNENILSVTIGNTAPIDFNITAIARVAYQDYMVSKKYRFDNFPYDANKLEMAHHTDKYELKLIITKIDGYFDSKLNDFDGLHFDANLLVRKNR